MSSSLASTTSVAATVALFSYNGFVIGTYAAAIPTVQARFGLTPLALAALFVSIGIAAIVSMQVGGRLADRHGARRVTLATIPILIVGIAGFGQADNLPTLFAFGLVLGLGNGGIDVAMNAIGVQVERHRERPIMSFFHGMWSVGNLLGAACLVLLAALGLPSTIAITTTVATVLGVAIFAISWRIVPETAPVLHTNHEGTKTRLPPTVYLLGLMAIAFGLGEGTGMDWSALLVTQVTHVDPTVGSLGVSVLAAAMVVIRVLGDGLVARFGRRAVTRFGGACAAVGYLGVATGSNLPWLLVGWAMVGLGIGMIAPQVYATAGHTAGGRGLAVVVNFGYATFLIAPAIIGALVSTIGIQPTMLIPAALLSGLIFLARMLPGREARSD